MTGMEIIALILAIIILIKFIILSFISKKSLERNLKKLVKRTNCLTIVISILIIVLFYFMAVELTVSQILVSTVFGMLVFSLIIVQNPKIALKFAEESIEDKAHTWVSWTILIILSLLVLFILL